MDIILIFLIVTGVVAVILIAVNVFLLKLFIKTNQKIDELLEKGKIKDFKDIFMSQKDRMDSLDKKIEEGFLKIKNLEDICETTIRKVGVVRFNPFNDMGGNQSFIIAMLNSKNNGFLISSLFIKDGNRVYSKAIKNGKSEHILSKEEVEAISRAIGPETKK